jgi:hypothetical protein
LPPGETPGIHCIGGWVGPRKISPPPGWLRLVKEKITGCSEVRAKFVNKYGEQNTELLNAGWADDIPRGAEVP